MLIDFGKLNSAGTVDTALQPREIFVALPNKREGKFEYPRDVQTQVWDHWFKRRDESDLVVKMNTGSGKTVVGLLILKSCLNEKKGPTVYVVPDNYLLEQVLSEAKDLGIEATKDTNSPLFLSGKAVLVVNIHKLVNGLSVFGVGDDGIKIQIGSLLVDDAHACLDTIEDQFMITISCETEAYNELYDNFRESLHTQCEGKASEIEQGDPNAYMQVPFWTWQDQADLILKKDNIHSGVERLKSEKVGLVVLINRYDGIDLPKDACRILIIDGLPDVRHQIDKVNQGILMGSDRLTSQIIQRIEQGMGRGIRSSDDYCLVLLMRKNLTGQLYAKGAINKFSPATKAQLDISDKVSEQIKGQGLKEIWEVMSYLLYRNKEWVTASKGAVASLTYSEKSDFDRTAVTIRNSYDSADRKDYPNATTKLNSVINDTTDKPLKGYLMQCLAEYINFYDKSEAQKTLMSAASFNTRVMKPLEGIAYHKLDSLTMEQARACSEYLKTQHNDPNKIIIEINGLLERLIFKPETTNIFEESMKHLAQYLGFNSQRPEEEYNRGPDVLWEIGGRNPTFRTPLPRTGI